MRKTYRQNVQVGIARRASSTPRSEEVTAGPAFSLIVSEFSAGRAGHKPARHHLYGIAARERDWGNGWPGGNDVLLAVLRCASAPFPITELLSGKSSSEMVRILVAYRSEAFAARDASSV